ncbi:MAG: site-specific DNA-methyltransferase [Chloroflexota bacterium]|nr:site-specific DNA-methyltransferase [Chloroflexota bacterium]
MMPKNNIPLPLDQVLIGDCRQVLQTLPEDSVDLIFADPPYNLQLEGELWRPNQTLVDAVDDDWDQFDSFAQYDQFTREWLTACRRVLKPTGTLWVIGSYHNIYRVGKILQDLGFWFLNDVVWIKANPMPNFGGVRFTNAHETLLWMQKKKGAKYTFNYHAMKGLNDDLQMRSDWYMPTCTGKERLKDSEGEKAHPTQKPEALMYRIIMSSSNPGDVILDPFFGTGTTGAVAQKLHRHFIGVEIDKKYAELAMKRVNQAVQLAFDSQVYITPNPRRQKRVPFGNLVENGMLEPGQLLYFGEDSALTAKVLADGKLSFNDQRGSIHQIAKKINNGPNNGWKAWYYWDEKEKKRYPIDHLRELVRKELSK